MKNYNITKFKEALAALTPQERLYVAQFMDCEDYADEGMNSQDVYEALEKADTYSETGEPEEMSKEIWQSIEVVPLNKRILIRRSEFFIAERVETEDGELLWLTRDADNEECLSYEDEMKWKALGGDEEKD